MSQTQYLRDLLNRGVTVRAAGAHDGLSAIMARNAGFDAIWASGFEISAAHGVPDANIVTMSETSRPSCLMAAFVTTRMTAFSPGQSPPPVRMPIREICFRSPGTGRLRRTLLIRSDRNERASVRDVNAYGGADQRRLRPTAAHVVTLTCPAWYDEMRCPLEVWFVAA